ncbi:Transcription factor bye1 [Umbelopsis sp. WA50703]
MCYAHVRNLAKRDREASAEWAGSEEDEDEELPESPKRIERQKSSTPGKCLLTSCSKPARLESLFCSEKCATDHINEKATTRRKSRVTQSPETSSVRSPTAKDSSKKKQSSSASPQAISNENDPIRRNVVKSLTATLKGLIEAALKNDPTLFNPDDSSKSPSEASPAADTDKTENKDAMTTLSKEDAPPVNATEKAAAAASPPSAMHIAEKLAADIENSMFQHLAEPHPKFPTSKPQMCGEKYKGKFRSLLYNLKDKANEIFQLRVITGDLIPENLVNMSGEDMANPELKSMSESLRQKSIKNSILKIQNTPIIKKTHKGDIIMLPPKDNNSAEDQAGTRSPLVKLGEEKPEEDASRSPSSRKSSLSVTTPKSPSVKTDSLDEILARMTNSNEKYEEPGKRRADGTQSEERKKRKIDMEKLLGDEDVQLEIGSDDEGIITSTMKSNAGHMKADEASSYADSKASPKSPSVPKEYSLQAIWHGKTIMQQVAEFESYALQIGGRPLAQEDWSDIFTPTIWIEGRIPTDRVTDYLTQTQFSSTKELILIDIKSSQEADNQEADNLLKYFHSRNRYGVVARNKTTIKDFYIIPLTQQDQLPDCLVALNHELADTGRGRDMLLGVIVLNKKLSSDPRSPHERHQRHNSMSNRPLEQVTSQIPEPPSKETAPSLSPTSSASPNLANLLQGGELNPLLKQILSNKDIVSLLNKNQAPHANNNADGNTFNMASGPPQHGSYQPMQAANTYDPSYPHVTNNQPPNLPPAARNQAPYNQYGNNIPPTSGYQQPYQRNWNAPNPPYRPHDGGRPPPPNNPVRHSRWDTPKNDGYSPYPTGPAAMYDQRDRGPPRGPAEYNRGRGRGSYGHNNGRGRRGHPGDAGRPPRRR